MDILTRRMNHQMTPKAYLWMLEMQLINNRIFFSFCYSRCASWDA